MQDIECRLKTILTGPAFLFYRMLTHKICVFTSLLNRFFNSFLSFWIKKLKYKTAVCSFTMGLTVVCHGAIYTILYSHETSRYETIVRRSEHAEKIK